MMTSTTPPEPSHEQFAQWWAEAKRVHADNLGLAPVHLARLAAAWGWEARGTAEDSSVVEAPPGEIPGEIHELFADLERKERNFHDFRSLRKSLQAAPFPVTTEMAPPPADGDVGELVAWLRRESNAASICGEEETSQFTARAAALIQQQAAELERLRVAIPREEYHEDFGPVTWWRFPVVEPAWIGWPTDSDWPGYHTHFTPHPADPALPLPSGEVRK